MEHFIKNIAQFGTLMMVLLALALSAACAPANTVEPEEKPEQVTMYVGSEKVDCEGEGPTKCLLVKFEKDSEWTLFYFNIAGFEYVPGFEYELLVTKTEVENPPAGGSSIQYTLVEVVGKTKVESAAPAEEPELATMYVGPETAECVGVGPMTCLLVKYEKDSEWTMFYENIAGFEYEPGFEYELLVEKTKVDNPPADSSSIKYEMVELVNKTYVAKKVGLANPASVYCEEQGGRLEIRSDEAGNQYGACIFDDGSECEEWAFFRGECEPGVTESMPSTDPLSGTDWDLVSYGDQIPLMDSKPTLQFIEDRISGSTGCNNFFGGYELDGDEISIGQMGSTLMACEGLMEQETAILAILQEAVSFSLETDTLTIHTPQGDLVYKPKQDLSLEGPIWVLSGLAKDMVIISTWVDEAITAEFVDGQVSGSGGCNNYFSAYELDGNSLTLGPIGATRMMCEDEVSQWEMEFFAALETVAGYTITRGTLTLTDAGGSTLITFQAQGAAP